MRRSQRKAKTLRASTPPPLVDDDAGEAFADTQIQASDGVLEVAKKYALLRQQKYSHDERGEAITREIKHLEEWLLEQMGGECQNLQVNIDDDGTPKRVTVYQIDDTNVWKGTGVETPDLCRALEICGWGDFVGPTYNQRSLKAAVREARRKFADREDADVARWWCPRCDSFCGDDSITTYVDAEGSTLFEAEIKEQDLAAPCCGNCHDPVGEGGAAVLVEMENGLPKMLGELLIIEDFKKLGCRRA